MNIKTDLEDWPFSSGAQVMGMKLPEYLAWAGNSTMHTKKLLLPTIQRGFVWKPKQIVDLWDSLLRGMPIGSLMVSKLAAGDWATNIGGEKRVSTEVQSESIGLLDGQQRTLSMLLGWSKEHSEQHCLWIYLGMDGEAGAPFELRITTRAQPFGFQRLSQTRLSRYDRKKAREEYDDRYPQYKYALENNGKDKKRDYELFDLVQYNQSEQPRPYVAGGNNELFIRLTDAWDVFRGPSSKDTFVHKLFGDSLENKGTDRVGRLYDAFERIAKLEVPLVLIPKYISQNKSEEKDDKNKEFIAPLILLFERIGSNATKLTPEDLLFSMIKQQWPQAHDLVEKVRNIDFYPMNSSDYVMTAYRLAAAQVEDAGKIGDSPRPKTSDFHRHLGVLLGTRESPGQLRKYLAECSEFVSAFQTLHKTLLYKKDENDNGIPNYMLPHLSRGLIQVLLRWIMLTSDQQMIVENRNTIIAFTLFWYLHVWNEDGASKKAFEIVSDKGKGTFPAEAIYDALIVSNSGNENEIGFALPLMSPEKLKLILLPYESTELITKEKLFKDDKVEHNIVPQRELYKRFCWWRKPVLLWLQREYVGKSFSKFTSDSNLTDEDTVPYDYDHLCPQDHWGKHWSYFKEECPDQNFQSARHDIGNCIGNLHVLESSLNRSFGDCSLAEKLKKGSEDNVWHSEDSLLYPFPELEKLWGDTSPLDGDEKKQHTWHEHRIKSFQSAVFRRAEALYRQYYDACKYILQEQKQE
jgi:hypothetical protein